MYVGNVSDFFYKDRNWIFEQPKFCLKEKSNINLFKINGKYFKINLFSGKLEPLGKDEVLLSTYGKKVKNLSVEKDKLNLPNILLRDSKNPFFEFFTPAINKITSYYDSFKDKEICLTPENKNKNEKLQIKLTGATQKPNLSKKSSKFAEYKSNILNLIEQKKRKLYFNTSNCISESTKCANTSEGNEKNASTNNFVSSYYYPSNVFRKRLSIKTRKKWDIDNEKDKKYTEALVIEDNDNSIVRNLKNDMYKEQLFTQMYKEYNFYSDKENPKYIKLSLPKLFEKNISLFKSLDFFSKDRTPFHKKMFFEGIKREKINEKNEKNDLNF